MNGRTKRVDGAGLLMQVPRRSGCMGCILAWPDGRLAHLRDGKTCSSIIGSDAGIGRHPYSLDGADCRHHIWVDSEEPEVPRKLMSKQMQKATEVSEYLRKQPVPNYIMGMLQDCRERKTKDPVTESPLELISEKVYKKVGGKIVCLGNLKDYEEKECEPTLDTWYATGGPGPAEKPWRPTLYRDTYQEQLDTVQIRNAKFRSTSRKKSKVSGSLQDPTQTVVVVIGRQKYMDDI